MPDISGHTRAWLEQQQAYHTKMIAKTSRERARVKKTIKRKGSMYKELTRQARMYAKVLEGINKLLQEENWEL